MKRNTPNHPKMVDLADRIDGPLCLAVGVLEMLWQYTAKYTPRGNIGKVSDQAIARAVDWRGDAGQLVAALVDSRWLDRDSEHRLIIHDWSAHCEDAVRKALQRSGESFVTASGQCPDISRTKSEEVTDEIRQAAAKAKAKAVVVVSEKTTTPEVSQALAVVEPEEFSVLAIFERTEALYCMAGVATADGHKQMIIQNLIGISPPERRERIPRYVTWALGTGKWDKPGKTKGFLALMRDGDWDVDLTPRTLPAAREPTKRESAIQQAARALREEVCR